MAIEATYTITYTDEQIEDFLLQHQAGHDELDRFRSTGDIGHYDSDHLFRWLTETYFDLDECKWERTV